MKRVDKKILNQKVKDKEEELFLLFLSDGKLDEKRANKISKDIRVLREMLSER